MSIRVLTGDCHDILKTLDSESVHCVVTSPLIDYGLRDYGTAQWDGGDANCPHLRAPGGTGGDPKYGPNKGNAGGAPTPMGLSCLHCGATRIDSQLGLESTPAEYIANMVAVFREVRRVLRKDGTLWLNIGDSYSGSGNGSNDHRQAGTHESASLSLNAEKYRGQKPGVIHGLKPKDLIGIPWELAKALRDPYYAGRIKAERDRAWLAAIIDGEGCMSGYHHTRRDDGTQRTGLNITITNSSTRLLDEADRIWPGARILHNHHGSGHLGLRDTYRWLVHGVENEMLLMRELYPYLIAKKAQAMVAYNLLVLMADAKRLGHSSRRDEVRDKRSRLIHVLSALNQDKPTEIPPWCVVPPTVLEDGWYLRSEITWCKRAPMPESVTDRPTSATEKVFLLTKSARYFYDQDAVRELGVEPDRQRSDRIGGANGHLVRHGEQGVMGASAMRNMRNYWLLGPEPFSEAHFATYPTALVEPCIKAGTSEKGCCPECGAPWVRVVEREGSTYADRKLRGVEGPYNFRPELYSSAGSMGGSAAITTGWRPSCKHADLTPAPCTVLDCFAGAGTTLLVADRLQRDAIGIELNPTYAAMARRRVYNDGPMFAQVAD